MSSWLNETSKPDNLSKDEWEQRLALKDVAEVFQSDCIILDLDAPSTTGGRYVEWGVACYPGSMRLRYTVGADNKGCFNQLADAHYRTWDDLLEVFPTAATRPLEG